MDVDGEPYTLGLHLIGTGNIETLQIISSTQVAMVRMQLHGRILASMLMEAM